MHRAVRWVAYALLALLALNLLAYPFSLLLPKPGTPVQNFAMVLLIELIIVILFADVFYVKRVTRLKTAPPAAKNAAKEDLIWTIIEFDYPLFITALFLIIQIVIIHKIAF